MQAVPTAPPPADAKTGSAINPAWKQVFPLTVPDHDGQPPTGLFVGFGEPTGAIGTLKSMASTYPVRMADPTWQAQRAPRIALALVLSVIAGIIGNALARPLSMAVQEADPTLSFVAFFFPLIQMLGLLVFWPAAAVGYVLGGLVAKKTPQGATATCTMLGTGGFAISTRTPVADEVVLVRFDGSRLAHGDRTTKTIYRQAGDPGPGIEITVRKASFVWTAPDGRELYRFVFDREVDRAPHAHPRFLGSTAFTHDRIVLGRELDGAGVRFAFTDSAEYIHVARQRIDFGLGAQPFSLAPPQISRAALQGDHIVFTLPTGALPRPNGYRAGAVASPTLLPARRRRRGTPPRPLRRPLRCAPPQRTSARLVPLRQLRRRPFRSRASSRRPRLSQRPSAAPSSNGPKLASVPHWAP